MDGLMWLPYMFIENNGKEQSQGGFSGANGSQVGCKASNGGSLAVRAQMGRLSLPCIPQWNRSSTASEIWQSTYPLFS
jgi:hypothetical protein